MRRVSFQWLIVALAMLAGHARAYADEACAGSVVYVLRHAEKATAADDHGDAELSDAGRKRALALAAHFAEQPIDAIYATHLRRTQHTVVPLALAADREIRVLSADDTEGLLRRLRGQHCGTAVVVAGHSNTVPEILRGLGVSEPPTIANDDYGTIWAVRPTGTGAVSVEEQRFGDPP